MNASIQKTGNNMRVLPDTNACSILWRHGSQVEHALNQADFVYISTIVIGELFAGFKRGNQEAKNKKLFASFIQSPTISIIPVSQDTAEIYAQIKYGLGKLGKPIPSNDLWIAAHAMETGSVLVTYDRHFLKIPGLRLWDELTNKN